MSAPHIVDFAPTPTTEPMPGDALFDDIDASPPAKPLSVWTPDELLAWQPPTDDVIVGELDRGYVVREELTVVIGPPGVGKSRLISWGAICAITGRAFAGLPTNNGPTKWLLVGNENSRRRQRHDLERMMSALTDEERALVRSHLRLHVLAEPRDGCLDLGDHEAREAIGATLRLHAPDVVVFDPWANMVPGDENKNADVRDGVRHLMNIVRLTAPRAACIVVHHARTGAATVSLAGNRFAGASLSRGGKALPSAARCEIAVWPGDSEDGGRIVITCEKSNNAPLFVPRGLKLDADTMTYAIDPDFSAEAWKDDVDGKRRQETVSLEDIVRAVQEECPMAGDAVKSAVIVSKVREATTGSVRTIKRRIGDALKAGYLRSGDTLGSYRLGAKPLRK